jgi:inner membrane transporter RhtA
VLLLTAPWRGDVDALGVAYAGAAALGWAAYILLTQRVGGQVPGVRGLAVSLPVAAVAATFTVHPAVVVSLTGRDVLTGAVLGLLLIVGYGLEMLALRRVSAAAFGTLMALEPAVALLIGAVALRQIPDALGVAGIILVVTAGLGAVSQPHPAAEPPGGDHTEDDRTVVAARRQGDPA